MSAQVEEGPLTTAAADNAGDDAPAKAFQPGTLLEAAFVDPAYAWPPVDGEGKNAIELQASSALMDDESIHTTDSMRQKMTLPEKPRTTLRKKSWWNCCKSDSAVEVVDMRQYEDLKKQALDARFLHKQMKKDAERMRRKKDKYSRVPEGILIYQLDTATHKLKLLSQPHIKTDLKTLVREMQVVSASPSNSKTRRSIQIRGAKGETVTLEACEQRTAISWLEAMDMMLANKKDFSLTDSSREWGKENLTQQERATIEGDYLNLADYSNKLLRAGATGDPKTKVSAGGIYYNIEIQRESGDNSDPNDEEALEVIAKRRAVIKDSWDFYRLICSLLRDRRKYDEVFQKMQMDPVYPYLNSMTGLNDPGEAGYENMDKLVLQKDLPEFSNMSKTQIAQVLIKQAEEAMPSLIEICKALAGSLGMEEVGLGPVKEVSSALRKAEKKYDGDLLKITDYCRALLVVKDFPSLLALLELARDSFGPLIRRVKLSTLKSDHQPKTGGYRDCIINLELKNHVCEIQVHLWPMWVVCGVDGFRHYRHCVEYSTDSFGDPYDALDGLDRKTVAELIVMAEETVASIPLNSLEWYQEKFILDYFAEVGLFLKHGLDVWAEVTLRHLIKLRTESPDIGPDHQETVILYRYLERVLVTQGKNAEAREITKKMHAAEKTIKDEQKAAEKSLWDSLFNTPTDAIELIMDPNKKEREEEQKLRKEVKASKKQWRRIRQERFQFLDASVRQSSLVTEEKKLEDPSE